MSARNDYLDWKGIVVGDVLQVSGRLIAGTFRRRTTILGWRIFIHDPH
jgi:hypothetical protein